MKDLKIALICVSATLLIVCVACNRFEKNHEQIQQETDNTGDIRDVTKVKDTLHQSTDRDTVTPNIQ